jgi:hypothetical protein
MNRALAELDDLLSRSVAPLEHIERETARRRWCASLECELLLAHMDATVLRRELTR